MPSQTCAHQESSLSRNLNTCRGVKSSYELLLLSSEQSYSSPFVPPPQQTVVCLAFFHPLSCELCILTLERLMPFTRFGCSCSPMPQALPGPGVSANLPDPSSWNAQKWSGIKPKISPSFIYHNLIISSTVNVHGVEQITGFLIIICYIRNQAATLQEGNCSLLTVYLYSKQIYFKNLIALILYCNSAAVLFYPADIFL